MTCEELEKTAVEFNKRLADYAVQRLETSPLSLLKQKDTEGDKTGNPCDSIGNRDF
jgi:hypothetical protein